MKRIAVLSSSALLGISGILVASALARKPDPCSKNPRKCHTTTTTTTATTATTSTTTTTTTTSQATWPAPLRFAYENRAAQDQAVPNGYNLIDVSTASEADAVPAGTRALVWLYDYNNNTCKWEKDDAYVTNLVTQLANDPKVAGFYFSNEPHEWDCPAGTAVQQHKDRNALIHRLAPTKFTVVGIDGNDYPHFDGYGTEWSGAADIINYNPYPCFVWDTTTCDFAWYDHVIQSAQQNYDATGQKYSVAVQAFREAGEWRWPTPAEEAAMLERLKRPTLTGLAMYMTFSWNWRNDPLPNHADVLAEIRAYNQGQPSPCCG